jgi:hypothetical protein
MKNNFRKARNQNKFLPISNSRGQFSLHTSPSWERAEQQQISAIHHGMLTTLGTLSPAILYSCGFSGQQMTN